MRLPSGKWIQAIKTGLPASEQGLTFTVCLGPFLNDIAAGRLVRGSYWVEPSKQPAKPG